MKHLNKIFIGLISLSVCFGSAMAQEAKSQSTSENKPQIPNRSLPQVQQALNETARAPASQYLEQVKDEQLRFNKETSQLRMKHIEELRNMTLKNVNTLYDRQVANQKVLDRLSEESVKKNTNGVEVVAKSQEFIAETQKLQQKLDAQVKAKADNFQAMMTKRQEQLTARLATPVPPARRPASVQE